MTFRYVQIAREHWADLDGYAVGHGVPDPRKLPLDRFCHWVWWMLSRNSSDSDREKLRAKIWRPPLNLDHPIEARSPWSAENETKAFAAIKAQLNLGGKSPSKPPASS